MNTNYRLLACSVPVLFVLLAAAGAEGCGGTISLPAAAADGAAPDDDSDGSVADASVDAALSPDSAGDMDASAAGLCLLLDDAGTFGGAGPPQDPDCRSEAHLQCGSSVNLPADCKAICPGSDSNNFAFCKAGPEGTVVCSYYCG